MCSVVRATNVTLKSHMKSSNESDINDVPTSNFEQDRRIHGPRMPCFSAYRTSLDSSALLAVVLLFDAHEQL